MKYIRIFGFMGLLIGLIVVAAGCTSTPAASETASDSPVASGVEHESHEQLGDIWFIMEINRGGGSGTVGEILLQSGQSGGDTVIVTIKDETQIAELNMDEPVEASFGSLKVGGRVEEIWVTGPALGSDPAQATAAEIVLSCPICGW